MQFGTHRISWNPHHAYTTSEAQIFTALYEGLTIFHPATLKPVPGAAESWSISEDGLTITFHLRNGLHWSHGEIITSNDFKESWIHLLSPDTRAEYASLLDDLAGAYEYRTGIAGPDGLGIETPDSRTLVVRLKHPSPQFLSILCHFSFVPVHKVYRNTVDWSKVTSVPVNGPYIIKTRNSEEVILTKNPYYWDAENIGIDELQLLFNDDSDKIMAEFNRFEIDWVISGINLLALGKQESLVTSPSFSTTYYYFSNRNEAWSNEKVRRALSLLLPWEEIRGQQLIPGASLVPPIPDYPPADAGYPPVDERRMQAMKLLDEAGYPDGQGLPSLTIRIPSEDIAVNYMMPIWQKELGLEVFIESIPHPNYYDSIKRGGYDIATLTWTGDYADPWTFLGMWLTDSSFNESGFSNTRYDSLLREAALLPYRDRLEKLSEAEEILLHSGQVMPIAHNPAINLIDLRFFDGWFSNVLNIHPFKNLTSIPGYTIPGVVRKQLDRSKDLSQLGHSG